MPWENIHPQRCGLKGRESWGNTSQAELSRPFRPQRLSSFLPRASACGLSPGLRSPGPLGGEDDPVRGKIKVSAHAPVPLPSSPPPRERGNACARYCRRVRCAHGEGGEKQHVRTAHPTQIPHFCLDRALGCRPFGPQAPISRGFPGRPRRPAPATWVGPCRAGGLPARHGKQEGSGGHPARVLRNGCINCQRAPSGPEEACLPSRSIVRPVHHRFDVNTMEHLAIRCQGDGLQPCASLVFWLAECSAAAAERSAASPEGSATSLERSQAFGNVPPAPRKAPRFPRHAPRVSRNVPLPF